MTAGRVAVVLAAEVPGAFAEASLAGFVREVSGRGEVVAVGSNVPGMDGVRRVEAPPGRLVPELWRDGLRSVDAELVAFSTTQMVPRAGWLEAMLAGLARGGPHALGVGGAILPGDGLGVVDRAIYLLRFLNYAQSLPRRPSGENSLYRRDALVGVADSWADGFWEADVHERLEAQSAAWGKAPEARLDYRGSTRLGTMVRRRVIHGRRFGASRLGGRSLAGRIARAVAAPLVPPLLLARAGRGLAGAGWRVGPWIGAVPPFLVLASAWSAGEASGTLRPSSRRVSN